MAYTDLFGQRIDHAAARLRTAEELAGWLRGAIRAGTAAASLGDGLGALSRLARRFARWRARRAALAELAALDRRTLADLGLSPFELGSVVAEAMGDAPPTRLRSLPVAARPNIVRTQPAGAVNDNAPRAPHRDRVVGTDRRHRVV